MGCEVQRAHAKAPPLGEGGETGVLPMSTARASASARLVRLARWTVLAAAVAVFCARFDPGTNNWWVNSLWALALVCWAFEIRSAADRDEGLLRRVRWADGLPLGLLLVVFAAVWLPFYNNWRWTQAGDSISWFVTAVGPATRGLSQSVFSLHGPDGNASLLSCLGYNSLMFVFEPTFFWHRVGKLIASCVALAAVYTYFGMTVGRRWALLVVFCMATNYVWIRFSYVSDHLVQSHIFSYLTLACATVIVQQPVRLLPWMVCGLIGGLSLFFPQTAWAEVSVVGMLLVGWALYTKRVRGVLVYAVTFLITAMPVLLQFPTLLEMSMRQARSIFEWGYLLRIFSMIIRLPYDCSIHSSVGVDGDFLRWPLGELYVVGAVMAALAVFPPLCKALRLPRIAPVLLALLLWNAVLMTLTNNAYGTPSPKRVYHLIPLQVGLALLPAYAIYAWCSTRKWSRVVAIGLVAAVVCVYASENLRLIVYPRKGTYGGNIFDGLVELRQRFPERSVQVFSSRDFLVDEIVAPTSFFNQAYYLRDTVSLQRSFTAEAVHQACASGAVLCYEPNYDAARFNEASAAEGQNLKPFPLLNSNELVCFACVPAGEKGHVRVSSSVGFKPRSSRSGSSG